jgi:hypothetical protein
MKNGLTIKEHEQMIELIKLGYSTEKISKWMNVYETYVLRYTDEQDIIEPVIDAYKLDVENPYANYTEKDFESTDLSEFRNWVREHIDPNIAANARRTMVMKSYEECMAKMEDK